MLLAEYPQLLDWTGRQLRRSGKLVTIPANVKPLPDRVGISVDIRVDCVGRFNKRHASAVGCNESLKRQAERPGCDRSLNTELSRFVFAQENRLHISTAY